MPTWNDSMNQRQEKVRRKWKMSGNVWMFSNEIDDEDLEFMSHDYVTYNMAYVVVVY